MFQEWEIPSFRFDQLIEFCMEFFKSRRFSASVERKGAALAVVKADLASPLGTLSVTVEHIGTTLKLTFPPPSRAGRDLNRFIGIFVTGLGVKGDAERQLFLDRLEQDFWEYLDQRLADLAAESDLGSD